MVLLILISFLIEVGVLLYLEKKAWNTLYTPLNFLMLPYVVVLLITVAVCGHWGITDFYFPSILYWSVGLFLFAIPSCMLGFSLQRHDKPVMSPIRDDDDGGIWLFLTVVVCLAFLYRLKQVLETSSAMLGSEEFGEDFDGHGIWAHLSKFYTPLLVMGIYYINRKRWWMIIPIIIMLAFSFLHQVKGWIIIPCVAGLAMRLYSGRTRLDLKFILWVLAGGVSVFLISYIMALVFGNNSAMGGYIIEFIMRHFVHYLTSGTLGFSMDLAAGMPDKGDTQVLFAQFVNIIHLFTGEPLISPINSLYFHTGLNMTNVRTMFGTVAVYCNPARFAIVTLFLSFTMYMLRIMAIKFNNVYVYVIYFYQCALLCMGWFEYYFFHLDTIEVPFMSCLIWLIVYMWKGNKKVLNNESIQ